MDQTPEKSCQNEKSQIQDFPEKLEAEVKSEEIDAAEEVSTVDDGDDDDDVDDILEEFSTTEGNEEINSNELEHPLTPQPPVPTQTDTTERPVTPSESPVIPVTPPAEEKTPQTNIETSLPVQDPLSIENENKKELEMMKDINRLQNELKNAANKVNTLQQQLQGITHQ